MATDANLSESELSGLASHIKQREKLRSSSMYNVRLDSDYMPQLFGGKEDVTRNKSSFNLLDLSQPFLYQRVESYSPASQDDIQREETLPQGNDLGNECMPLMVEVLANVHVEELDLYLSMAIKELWSC